VPRFNIAPTQPITVIRKPHKLELLRWGLTLPNPRAGGLNVRVESLNAPFYRDSIHGRRCLILADGFYEWKVIGDPEAKKPAKQTLFNPPPLTAGRSHSRGSGTART
jgi:putative SOS response-associated peptidase YedK